MSTTTRKPLLPAYPGVGSLSRASYRIYEEQCVSDPSHPKSASQYNSGAAIGYVIAGWCDYRAPNGAITVVPGSAVFGNEGEHYDVDHHECPGNRRVVVRFGRQFLQSVAEAYHLDNARFAVVGLPPGKSALDVFRCLSTIARGGDQAEEAAILLAGTALTAKELPRRSRNLSGRERRRVMSAVRFIESSFSHSCSIETLAGISGLSRFHFARLFKSVTGQSPSQYVITTRLRAAAIRLAETANPVTEIALDVGFNDISYFGFCFRTAFGRTPRQMRRELGRPPLASRQFWAGTEKIVSPPGRAL